MLLLLVSWELVVLVWSAFVSWELVWATSSVENMVCVIDWLTGLGSVGRSWSGVFNSCIDGGRRFSDARGSPPCNLLDRVLNIMEEGLDIES
jgi:hypothetical protein